MKDYHPLYRDLVECCEKGARSFRRFEVFEHVCCIVNVAVAVVALVDSEFFAAAFFATLAAMFFAGSRHSARLVRKWEGFAEQHRQEGREYAARVGWRP